MGKEEIKLTKQQYEIVKAVAEAEEGIKTKDIAKQFGVAIQKVNGSIRGLLRKGIIEADEESDPHSPLYWLRPDIEISEQEEQGKIKVYAKSATGEKTEDEGDGGIGKDKDFSTIEEYISFKGLEGIDELKRKQLEEWLTTYNIGRQPRNVVLRQYETNPHVRYTRNGLYDTLRGAGVKEDWTKGIVEQVFLIEDQYAPFLRESDRDTLLYRKNPNAAIQPMRKPVFDERFGDRPDERFREPVLEQRVFSYTNRDRGYGQRQGGLEGKGVEGRDIRDIVREVVGEVLRNQQGDTVPRGRRYNLNPYGGYDSGGVTRQPLGFSSPGDVEIVEEPILDDKGNPRHDSKGNIIYRKRYVRTDKEERAEKEWRNRYENMRDKFSELEKKVGDSKMKGEIDYLKGKLDSIEKNPPGTGLPPEISVQLKQIEQSYNLLVHLLDKTTNLAMAHMGIPPEGEGGTRVALTDEELVELERKRREKEG